MSASPGVATVPLRSAVSKLLSMLTMNSCLATTQRGATFLEIEIEEGIERNPLIPFAFELEKVHTFRYRF